MKILAFIPARGGSKGIQHKNLVDLAGKPLIQYTLDLLKHLPESIYPFVSTDDEEIAAYCSGQGLDMGYRRPSILAGDFSPIIDAIRDALDWLVKHRDYRPDAVLLLQPTSPIRFPEEMKEAIARFETLDLQSMVSVTPMREHPYECVEMKDGKWEYLKQPTTATTARQQYEQSFYFIDGSFYLATVEFLRQHNGFIQEHVTELFTLQRTWPIDIDHPDDLRVASAFVQGK
jgi:CMP-N-acetylneuraminic acid synthetase